MTFRYPTIHLSSVFFLFLLLISFISFTLASQLIPRDSPNNRCGPQFSNNSCLSGSRLFCCSQHSYCGDTPDHCGAACQQDYGNCGSQTNSNPNPTPTSSIKLRPRLGNVPYGSSIYSCTTSGDIALTFDDGPWQYTSQLLDILASRGVKVTFFVTGNNLGKGAIDAPGSPWAPIIRRAYNEGHQIGSHTWDHLDLHGLSEADRVFEMTRNEQALSNIIGRYPTYMRPPYSHCAGPCLQTLDNLGYHVIVWDLDTDDYNNDNPSLIQNSKDTVRNAIVRSNPSNRSFLSIAHDTHYQTVVNLTGYQIDVGIANGYRFVRLGECLGDPVGNWYRT